MSLLSPPPLPALLGRVQAISQGQPVAFVLAGHNGSGKTSLWYERLAPVLQRPLLNADRLVTSTLPPVHPQGRLVPWAARMRDQDLRWQLLARDGIAEFTQLVTARKMSFALETVFSHWERQPDGSFNSKVSVIRHLQASGYLVVLFFIGLANVELSIARVRQRRERGGHDVPRAKLKARFARTQLAIGQAAPVADMTVMFENSLGMELAYRVSRVQMGESVLFDCRDGRYDIPADLRMAATLWLGKVFGSLPSAPQGEEGEVKVRA